MQKACGAFLINLQVEDVSFFNAAMEKIAKWKKY